MPSSLGAKIRELRGRRGLTLGDLSERCGLSVPYLSDIERGNRTPNDNNVLSRIGTALNVQLGELLVAAAADRHQFSLPYVPGRDTANRVGAELTRGWNDLTPEELEAIDKILQRRRTTDALD